MKQFSVCIEEALFRLPAHRDRALNYKMEEVPLVDFYAQKGKLLFILNESFFIPQTYEKLFPLSLADLAIEGHLADL